MVTPEISDPILFETAFQLAPIGMALVDIQGRWLKVNQALCDLVGYSEAELLQLDFQSITYPADLAPDVAQAQRLLSGELSSYRLEKRYIRKDGNLVWVLLCGALVRDSQGQPKFFIAQIEDITASKIHLAELESARRELAEMNSLLGGIFDSTQDGMAALDCDFRFISFNPAFASEFASLFNVNVRLGDTLVEALTDLPQERDELLALWARALAGEELQKEMAFRAVNGSQHLLQLRFYPLKGLKDRIVGAFVVTRDVSGARSMEQRLRDSERRFRAIFDNTFQFTGLLSPDGILLEANRTALEFGGIRAEDVIGRPFWEARWWTLSEETQIRLQAAIRDAANGEFVRYEVDVRGTDTRIATIDFSLKPFYNEQGNVELLIPEGRDVTESRRAESARRDSERILRSFFESAPMMMGIVELDTNKPGDFLHVSDNWKAATFYGSTPEAMRFRWSSQLGSSEATRETWIAHYEQSSVSGVPVHFEYEHVADGISRWLMATVSYIGEAGTGRRRFSYIISDITSRKQSESQIVRHQELLEEANAKLAALARTDGLTAVYNRRAFEEALRVERERCLRNESTFSLIMLDVDHFKTFNDRYGHLTGDTVLKQLAGILGETIRPSDFLARYGGEEFAIILPHTDTAGSAIAAERCRRAVESATWACEPVTSSFGVATFHGCITPEELIEQADQALYAAKWTGRNKVVHHSTLVSEDDAETVS